MARLSVAVHVQHPTTREWVVLEPGEEPALELAAEITNPGAWEGGVLPEPEDQAEGEGPPPSASPRTKRPIRSRSRMPTWSQRLLRSSRRKTATT